MVNDEPIIPPAPDGEENAVPEEPQAEAGGAGNGHKIPPPTIDDDEEYVGYRHPPKKHRFKPGESGNPNGRRKAALGLKTLLRQELSEKVQITEGGQTRWISKLQLMVKRLSEKGAKGDLKAIEKLIEFGGRVFEDDEEVSRALTADEAEIIRDLERRERDSQQFLRRKRDDNDDGGEIDA